MSAIIPFPKRPRLTQEAKQRLERFVAPVDPAIKPFLDRIAAMLVASMREDSIHKSRVAAPPARDDDSPSGGNLSKE